MRTVGRTAGARSARASSAVGLVTVGLDTSVVVRLLVGEPVAQAEAARRALQRAHERNEPVFVCDLVLAEAYFALQHHYRVPKGEARELLLRFARSGLVRPQPPEALGALAEEHGPGLVDRLIHARYRGLGATTLTFERRLAALEGAVRPS